MTLSIAVPLLVLLFLLWRIGQVGQRPKGYPPGPQTLPLIGNLHQMPKTQAHRQFELWAREYGPVYSLILGTKVVVVLSSAQAVKDLLDKRSAIYSSRPESYLGQDIFSGGFRVLLMPYGKKLQKMRSLAGRVLNDNVSKAYIPYQEVESKAMMAAMMDRPDLFIDHIRRYTASLTTQMTFGFRVVDQEDQKFKKMFRIFERFSEICTSQTAALLDVHPMLRSLPDFLLPIRKDARKMHKMEYKFFTGLFLDAKNSLQSARSNPCFCVDLARVQAEEGVSDGEAGYTAGSFLQAGSETASSILVGFIQAMVIFPDVARQAQVELDRVCGSERMPALEDAPMLPYVRGCIKESLRWMPTTLLGVPHALTRDDTYAGFLLPRDATVIYNVWAIHNDPARYPDPRVFDPTRWDGDSQTSAEAAVNPDVGRRDHFVFGAGRRLCQGMHISDRTLFLAISRLLWAFDFGRQVDPVSGVELVPDMDDLTESMFAMPRPFPARIIPRDQTRARRVRDEWGRVEMELLDEQGQWRNAPKGLIWSK